MVNLTIGGGNFKGISYVGALEYLYKNNLINKIDNFYGSSVGTIIGIFYLIGYKPFEILEILLNINLEDYWDFSFNNIEKNYSLISDSFFRKIKEVFEKKENSNISFIEFYKKYGVKLNLFSTSLKQRKNICFNIENYPDINVLKIVQASCTIPIIFPPVKIGDEYYIDGCVKSIDGISRNIILNDNNIHFVIKSDYSNKNINSFIDYISEVINCTLQNEENFETDYTITIKTSHEYDNVFNFSNIKFNDKIKLYYNGLIQAKNKLYNKVTDILLIINEQILNTEIDKINNNEIVDTDHSIYNKVNINKNSNQMNKENESKENNEVNEVNESNEVNELNERNESNEVNELNESNESNEVNERNESKDSNDSNEIN